MAAKRIERFIVLIKKDKPVAIMFGLSVLGLFIILGFLIKEFITLAILSSLPWCEIEKTKCGGQGYHIGCQPEHFPVNKDCRNIYLVHIDKLLKRAILKKHNEIRNEAASGFYDYNLIAQHKLNFPKASRMREVVWDHQLQQVAELQAETCTTVHESCRSTEKYSNVGQNMGSQNSSKRNDNALGVVTSLIGEWYNERFTTNPEIFKKFLDALNNKNERYLLMVNENVEKIGCAYIKYEIGTKKKNKVYGHQLTCNYSHSTNYSAVFTSGEPKSNCGSLNSHGVSVYKYLCGPVADNNII